MQDPIMPLVYIHDMPAIPLTISFHHGAELLGHLELVNWATPDQIASEVRAFLEGMLEYQKFMPPQFKATIE